MNKIAQKHLWIEILEEEKHRYTSSPFLLRLDRIQSVVRVTWRYSLALVAALFVVFFLANANAAEIARVTYFKNYAVLETEAFRGWSWAGVCDMHRNGRGVYGSFESRHFRVDMNDSNGAEAGCGAQYIPSRVKYDIHVCERDFGCSGVWTYFAY